MTTRTGRAWPIGGMPPIVNPVSSRASFAVARRTSALAGDRREPREVHAVGAGHEADDGLERAVRVRGDEHQRLHDLAELRADRRRGLLGRVRRLAEHVDLERHALAGGSIDDPLDRRGMGRLGHGGSLPDGGVRSGDAQPCTARPLRGSPRARRRRRRRAVARRPRRGLARLGRRRRGGDRGRRRARARPRARPRADAPRRRPRLARPGADRRGRGRPASPIRRSPAAKDESDAELALLAAVDDGRDPGHRARRVRRPAAGPRAGQRVAARPPGARRDRGRAPRCAHARVPPDRTGSRRSAASGGRSRAGPGRPSRCCRSAATSTGVTTEGLRYPLRDEPLRVGPARGLSNVREAADAAVTLRAGGSS